MRGENDLGCGDASLAKGFPMAGPNAFPANFGPKHFSAKAWQWHGLECQAWGKKVKEKPHQFHRLQKDHLTQRSTNTNREV